MKVPAHWHFVNKTACGSWYARDSPECAVIREATGNWHVYLTTWRYPGDTYLPTRDRAIEEADRRIAKQEIKSCE
jgi:hypothetical protein